MLAKGHIRFEQGKDMTPFTELGQLLQVHVTSDLCAVS